MTMRKTRRKENDAREGGGRRGANKVTTRKLFKATSLPLRNCGCEFRSASKLLQ